MSKLNLSIFYQYEGYFPSAGRVLMGVFFLVMGVQKLIAIEPVAGYIAGVGLPYPMALAILAGVFEVIAGAALMAGYRAKDAAFLLTLFTVIVTAIFHGPNWWPNDPTGQIMFLKNAAILGGLLFMVPKLSN